MTMPDERTRSLLWAGEWLDEVRSDPTTPDDIRDSAAKIVVHYPDTAVIAELALRDRKSNSQSLLDVDTVIAYDKKRNKVRDQSVTTSTERTMALVFVHELARTARSNSELSEELRRQVPYVLRHYPNLNQIQMMARSSSEAGSEPLLDYDAVAEYLQELQAVDEKIMGKR